MTPDDDFRNIIFELISKTEIKDKDRFDILHPFWENFGVRNEKLKKNVGYYEKESIKNPCKMF